MLILQGFMLPGFAKTLLLKTTNLCTDWGDERIKLKRDFTCEIWTNDVLEYTATWEFDDEDGNAIIMKYKENEYDDETLVMYLEVVRPDDDDSERRGLSDRSGNKLISITKVEFQEKEYSTSNCERD